MTKKFYFVLASIFIVMLVGISQGGLTESSEARYAEIGREMAISNDFLHPRMLGIGHYHKPPVTYGITALGYKIFGFNEFGARFFLAVALLLQLLLVYKMGKLWFEDRKTGIFAALIYFTFPIVLASVLNLTTDAYLNTFILSSIYGFLVVKLKKKKSFLYLGYALLGIAFLIKGPVAFLPVALFMICYKISTKEPLKP
ncbi:MAG: glycosyltransferase family 39 protein, partial [Bacteroidota bacterium]|nr:glycosyltransferase family 39 protein [Bacteroidota bacterium]